MHDRIDTFKERRDALSVGDVRPDPLESIAKLPMSSADVIDDDHFVAGSAEFPYSVRANVSAASSDQDFHDGPISFSMPQQSFKTAAISRGKESSA
jgi:hypothetical protein